MSSSGVYETSASSLSLRTTSTVFFNNMRDKTLFDVLNKFFSLFHVLDKGMQGKE